MAWKTLSNRVNANLINAVVSHADHLTFVILQHLLHDLSCAFCLCFVFTWKKIHAANLSDIEVHYQMHAHQKEQINVWLKQVGVKSKLYSVSFSVLAFV